MVDRQTFNLRAGSSILPAPTRLTRANVHGTGDKQVPAGPVVAKVVANGSTR